MRRLAFRVGGHVMRASDSAILAGDESALDELVEAAVESISTGVEVTCAGVKMHLAAWRDPDHWGEDWRAKGIDPDDVAAMVERAVSS